MAVPSGYTPLAKIGIVDKGTYLASATYNKLDFVYYNGSTWLAQKDGLKGVTPAEGANWKYLAKGFVDENAANININDTSNLMGAGAGKATTLQKWGDKVANWLVNKVITNDNFVTKLTARLVNNGTTTSTGFALDARYGKTLTDKDASLQTAVDTLNRNKLTAPAGKRIIYGTVGPTSDANGATWVGFHPNFSSSDNIEVFVSFPDPYYRDRIIVGDKTYNGFTFFAYKDGQVLRNHKNWITYIAIGNA